MRVLQRGAVGVRVTNKRHSFSPLLARRIRARPRWPDGEAREMVFDPLLFDRPVDVEEWRDALHDSPAMVRTAPVARTRRFRILARSRSH